MAVPVTLAPAPGVVRVVLPIPFELSHVNVYLLRQRDGWLLIDAGIESERCFNALAAGLAAHGIAFHDIRTILLTHMHPDHIGLANRLVELSGARLFMHEAELEFLEGLLESGGTWAADGLRYGGVPEETRRRILMAVGVMRDIVRPLRPYGLLAGGETIDTGFDEIEIVWTPGHSPGHICAYGRRSRMLFSGDHLLTGITPNISWFRGRDNLASYLHSLRRLLPYEVHHVFPSHGESFTDWRAWIENTIRHHGERSETLRALLRPGPTTAHRLVPGVWPGDFGPFQHYFALFEVLAHLEHMRRLGQVRVREDADGSGVWSLPQE